MPVTFHEPEIYYINYNELFIGLNNDEFLNDKELQYYYLESWLDKLREADDDVIKNIEQKRKQFRSSSTKEPEIFKQEIGLSNQIISIQLRVSYILELTASVDKQQIRRLESNCFTSPYSAIKWTGVENPKVYPETINKPVILIPFCNGRYSWLLIDGNKRVTNAVRYNQKVNLIILDVQSLIDYDCFCSEFDMYAYIMYTELYYMKRETVLNKRNAKDLIKESFLYTGVCVNDKCF